MLFDQLKFGLQSSKSTRWTRHGNPKGRDQKNQIDVGQVGAQWISDASPVPNQQGITHQQQFGKIGARIDGQSSIPAAHFSAHQASQLIRHAIA